MPNDSNAAILRADAVTKRFGGLVAVDSVTMSVREGSIFGLIGPNGAGKTTLFNLLAGAMRPDTGRIHFKSKDVTGMSSPLICERGLTRTFQNPRPFFGNTVLKNAMVGGISRGRSARSARLAAQEALEYVGLWSRRDDLADILPLGQLKRLEVARCLATDPVMLLLDEPTGGLGVGEIDDFMALISGLPARGLTLLLIEHNMRVALGICEHVMVLNFGKVIAEGTGREVAQNPDVITAYLGQEAVGA